MEDYFDVEIDPSRVELHPAFVVYHQSIKEESYFQLGKLLTDVLKETEEKIDRRRRLSRKVLDLTSQFIKAYEKCYYFGLK